MISLKQYQRSSLDLGVGIAEIKAVALIEGGGEGFLPSGEPVILFEPHQFWRELVKRGIDPHKHLEGNEDILYQKWGEKSYGKYSAQHSRLARASKIHREAAIQSASWGLFQIMGYHYKACGCATLQEFINAMYKSEDEHLRLFCNYLKSTGLDKPLREHNWALFAEKYNGKGYKKNNYDVKLKNAFDNFNQFPYNQTN
jgi:hypothetical protein